MLKVVKSEQEGVPSPDEFRVPASDTKGHSARQWFRCVPSMARQLEQTIQSRQFPYRTKGDILRHALHRHMKWLSSIEGVPSVSGQVDVILEIMRDEEMSNDFTLVFDKLAERISKHMEEGSNREAIRLLLIVNNHVNAMPEGFWKNKYQSEIRRKYGSLMKGSDKAKLGGLDES